MHIGRYARASTFESTIRSRLKVITKSENQNVSLVKIKGYEERKRERVREKRTVRTKRQNGISFGFMLHPPRIWIFIRTKKNGELRKGKESKRKKIVLPRRNQWKKHANLFFIGRRIINSTSMYYMINLCILQVYWNWMMNGAIQEDGVGDVGGQSGDFMQETPSKWKSLRLQQRNSVKETVTVKGMMAWHRSRGLRWFVLGVQQHFCAYSNGKN